MRLFAELKYIRTMSAEDFNTLLSETLLSLGFKKSGVQFYIHRTPNIMVIHKKTFRGSFEGFYIAFTHDFNNEKIPIYLEDFPFSISMPELERQYQKHASAQQFNCDTNFITREVLPTRKTFEEVKHRYFNK